MGRGIRWGAPRKLSLLAIVLRVLMATFNVFLMAALWMLLLQNPILAFVCAVFQFAFTIFVFTKVSLLVEKKE
jgi:hypothetical protein